MATMDDDYFRAIIASEIQNAVGFLGGELSEQRRQAMEFYYSEPFGNEREGRSQVVLSDVLDTIEWTMPSLMRIFFGGSKVVKFEPEGPEDEEEAEAKTEYVNYVFRRDNPGFELAYMWMKDALLQKNGILKVWWDDVKETRVKHMQGVFPDDMEKLLNDPEIEIMEQEEVIDPSIQALLADMGADQVIPVWNIKLRHTTTKGKIEMCTIPPEEFLISRRARSMNDAIFMAHRVRRTVGELIEQGFDADVVYGLGDAGESDYNSERRAREDYDEEYYDFSGHSQDPSMREVWVYECYIKIDFDQDGIAELRKVTAAGDSMYEMLENEEVDNHPFHSITPIPVPHKFYGLSMADLVADLQKIRSTVFRQLMDNMYNINNNRVAISSKVNIEDQLTNRAGGIVRVATNLPDVAGHFAPIRTEPIIQHVAPVMDILRDERESRTGVTRYNQGLDSATLNDTATGISKIMSAANQRIELIARIFAETGFTTMARSICDLLVEHQDRERMVRLRGKWVPIDPRSWRASLNTTVDVGLGYDNKEQEALFMQTIMSVQATMMQAQGGFEGPMVNRENLYKAAEKLSNAMGFPHAENYFMNPDTPAAKKAVEQLMMRKDPEVEKNEAEAKKDQAELALKDKKIEYDHDVAQQKLEIDAAKVGISEDQVQLSHAAAMDGNAASRETAQTAAGARVNGDGSVGAKPNGAAGPAAPDPFAAALEVMGEGMSQMAKAIEQLGLMVAMNSGPKQVVRDAAGVIQGLETLPPNATIQ